MNKFSLLCLVALLGSSFPATADHQSDCHPPSLPGPGALVRACYGHYDEAADCGYWYSSDGYDEDRAILYAIYARAIVSSGDATPCADSGEPCTIWRTRATAYTNAFYAGGPIIGAVRLQPAEYQATLQTEDEDGPCASEPECTLAVAADNDDANLNEQATHPLPACQTLSDLGKPTPGGPEATVPEDTCVGDEAAMACYEHEDTYDPYANCDGTIDDAWLAAGGDTQLRALITYTCYEYGDFDTGPCWIRTRTIEVTSGGTTMGIERSFSDHCYSPIFNPGSGSCSTRVWFSDSITGYGHERQLPTTPAVQCADLA